MNSGKETGGSSGKSIDKSSRNRTLTISVFARRKARREKIVVLTAYDLTSALLVAEGGADAILVGDSVGMVVLGHENTLPVTVDDMVHHCRAVTRAQPGIPVIADMPYGSFHSGPADAVRHALRLVKEGGAHAVKIEGGRKRAEVIAAIRDAEIPVMGHLGLTPQSIHDLGGYKVQGRGAEAAERLKEEAAFLADAGCFAMVLECIPSALASEITVNIGIPTIGIGAGPGCDGQVLVFHDMLGLFKGLKPKFVKRYAELGDTAASAIATYADEVRRGAFPGPEHEYDENPSGRRDGSPTNVSGQSGYLGDVEGGSENGGN
jgi:3-methyl-2-oxobutanoate hydroxymethyltransferase